MPPESAFTYGLINKCRCAVGTMFFAPEESPTSEAVVPTTSATENRASFNKALWFSDLLYPILLRALGSAVSTKPPTQGMTAATEPVEVRRDGMVASSESVISRRLNPMPSRLCDEGHTRLRLFLNLGQRPVGVSQSRSGVASRVRREAYFTTAFVRLLQRSLRWQPGKFWLPGPTCFRRPPVTRHVRCVYQFHPGRS